MVTYTYSVALEACGGNGQPTCTHTGAANQYVLNGNEAVDLFVSDGDSLTFTLSQPMIGKPFMLCTPEGPENYCGVGYTATNYASAGTPLSKNGDTFTVVVSAAMTPTFTYGCTVESLMGGVIHVQAKYSSTASSSFSSTRAAFSSSKFSSSAFSSSIFSSSLFSSSVFSSSLFSSSAFSSSLISSSVRSSTAVSSSAFSSSSSSTAPSIFSSSSSSTKPFAISSSSSLSTGASFIPSSSSSSGLSVLSSSVISPPFVSSSSDINAPQGAAATSDSTGIIAGAAAGGAAVAIIIIILLFCWFRRRKDPSNSNLSSQPHPPFPTSPSFEFAALGLPPLDESEARSESFSAIPNAPPMGRSSNADIPMAPPLAPQSKRLSAGKSSPPPPTHSSSVHAPPVPPKSSFVKGSIVGNSSNVPVPPAHGGSLLDRLSSNMGKIFRPPLLPANSSASVPHHQHALSVSNSMLRYQDNPVASAAIDPIQESVSIGMYEADSVDLPIPQTHNKIELSQLHPLADDEEDEDLPVPIDHQHLGLNMDGYQDEGVRMKAEREISKLAKPSRSRKSAMGNQRDSDEEEEERDMRFRNHEHA